MLIAIVINSWVGFSRIARGEVMKLKQESFIKGLKTIGASDLRILFLHISPNIPWNLMRALCHKNCRKRMISVASMSYLGLGLQPPPTPDWGVMINDARQYFRQEPLLVVAPGLCILLLSLSIQPSRG
ncbi:MAG: ABC transporter permease subunit [Clostridium sp.]